VSVPVRNGICARLLNSCVHLHRILKHDVAGLVVTTAGDRIESQLATFEANFCDPRIKVLRELTTPNRRKQVLAAIPNISTKLLVNQDDRTYWPQHANFLPSLLAPFEKKNIAAVGSTLEARYHGYPFSFRGFWNFIGIAYPGGRNRGSSSPVTASTAGSGV
jgi:hypothetical protein